MMQVHILAQATYQPGEPAPEGYLAWHEWAETQHKAGLRQKECGRCGKWKDPQELSAMLDRCVMQSRKGPVTVATVVCHKCATPSNAGKEGAESVPSQLNVADAEKLPAVVRQVA